MKNNWIIVFVMVLFSSMNSFGQSNILPIAETKFCSDDQHSFLISTRPVTNREYIIYLLWLSNTQGIDYPNVFLNAIPGLRQKDAQEHISEFYDSDGGLVFETIFKYSEPFLKNYMFNPKYIDYPAVGVTWLQAGRYCKWLTDRFNEYKLIRDGYFLPDSLQSNEECFVTESYLADMYFGMRTNEKMDAFIKWEEGVLIPSFRLPTSKEIEASEKQSTWGTSFKAYEFSKSNFLSQWNDWYIAVSENEMTLNFSFFSKPFTIKSPSEEWMIIPTDYKELALDLQCQNKKLSIIDIFKFHHQDLLDYDSYSQLEKDSLGQMQYIIIDENCNKKPIAIERYRKTDSMDADTTALYYFRFLCPMKPSQYKL